MTRNFFGKSAKDFPDISSHSTSSNPSYITGTTKSYLSLEEIALKTELEEKSKSSKRLTYLREKTHLNADEQKEFDELKNLPKAKILKDEKSDLEKFRLTGIDATSEDTTIAISERHGVRNKQQQDACSVADLEFK
ncbi:MAG: hypothetical protein SFV53_06200, partial [Rickettsiales bacterium]|nr:hypothetical protein [Rickettsiales bacterium]